MKCWKKYKTFKNSFQILNSCKLVECLNIEPPNLNTIEQLMPFIFTINIHSKGN